MNTLFAIVLVLLTIHSLLLAIQLYLLNKDLLRNYEELLTIRLLLKSMSQRSALIPRQLEKRD